MGLLRRYTRGMNRDSGIIFAICVLAILVGGILYLGATPDTKPTEEVSFSVLSAGAAAVEMHEQKNYRVLDEEHFVEVWKLAYGTEAPMPNVDFDTHEVLAVFDGERTSGGYKVEVERILDLGTVREVRIVRTAPGTSCITTQALTSPFQMVVVPKTDNRIDRKDVNATVACE